jgi:hypothetical protein
MPDSHEEQVHDGVGVGVPRLWLVVDLTSYGVGVGPNWEVGVVAMTSQAVAMPGVSYAMAVAPSSSWVEGHETGVVDHGLRRPQMVAGMNDTENGTWEDPAHPSVALTIAGQWVGAWAWSLTVLQIGSMPV